MTVEAREKMSAEIQRDEEFCEAVKSGDAPPGMATPISDIGGRALDTGGIEASIAHRKRVLAEGTPERISGEKRVAAEKRLKEIKDVLQDRLLTHRENELMPKDGYEYHKAVRKSIGSEVGNPETRDLMMEFRGLSARLYPDDPEAQSIDALRRQT